MVTTVHKPITNKQRFLTSSSPCPICDGYDRMKRGQGERCYGYECDDPEYVYCTNDDYAGSLDRHDAGYKHKLHGDCHCGSKHGSAIHREAVKDVKPKKSHADDENFFTYDDERAVAKYHYCNAEGLRLYTVVRYQWPSDDPDKKYRKDFRPFRWEGSEPVAGIRQIKQRVLYNELALRKADKGTPVYWVESEKSVDKLTQIGLLAVCTQGGAITGTNSSKWNKAYAEAVKGHDVILLPDNDEAGETHVKNVAAGLKGIAATVRIVRLPDLPPRGDVYDWLGAGGTCEQLEEMTRPSKRKFLYASQVETKPVDYLWTKRLAKGMLTLLVGDPGLGKSMLTAKIAAAVTTGGMLPDGQKIEPGGVIIMAPEDSNEHTIVPRLKAAGAELSKIILLSEVPDFDSDGTPYNRPISFPEDAAILEEAIIESKASLVIIDPVLAMINGKYDAHKDQDSRAALARVLSVAKEQQCAVLGLFHLNKGQSGNALYRSSASIAFIAMARIGLFLVPDPDDPEDGRVLVNHKNNLAAKATGLRMTIEQTEDEIGCVEWAGKSSYTQDQLLNQNTSTDNPKSERESNLLAILEENKEAMSPDAIYKKLQEERKKKLLEEHPDMPPDEIDKQLQSGQSKDALEMMLKRKVEQGVLIRPFRGLYTYTGNQLYIEKPTEPETCVGYVGYVGLGNKSTHPISEANSKETNITNITNAPTDVTLNNNDDHKIITLHKNPTIARCETRFNSQMSETHEPGQTLTTDATGNSWCEQCSDHKKLMDLGYVKDWPSIILEAHGGKVKLSAGQEKYFKFARTSGHLLVAAAVAQLESMKDPK